MPSRSKRTRVIVGLVYVFVILVGAGISTPIPTPDGIAVPVLTGIVLVLHAGRRENMDELGYAIIGMYGINLLMFGYTVLHHLWTPFGTPNPRPDGLGWSVALTIVLCAGYGIMLRRFDEPSSHSAD